MSEPHVLIIGAGLTGLLIAHGLNQHNIPYTIFEAEEEGTFRPKEWSMGIHWGVPLLEKLLPESIAKRLVAEATVDPTLDYGSYPCNGSRIIDGVDGKLLKELGGEGRLLRVSRRKLRKLISEGIDVKMGHKLMGINYETAGKIIATFHNGKSYTGTILIGADGPKSTTRSLLLPEAEVQHLKGTVHLANTFAYGDAEKAKFVRNAHPVWSMALHPEIFVYLCTQDVRDPGKPEDWVFYLFVAWLGERKEGVRELMREKSKKLCEPFKSAIEWIPESVELGDSGIGFWVARDWDTHEGRVTLAGDAAHPMPPYRGQGLNHAIQDAYNFTEMMKTIKEDGGKGQEKLVGEYSREVAKRGGEETEMSTKNAYMMLGYEEFKESPYMKHGLARQG